MYLLNRRFNDEECVVQVMATFVTAYLTFYVAEPVLHTSGVIAVVICGITTRAFARMLIQDHEMMKKFWLLVEHILNTLLFILGGVLWGMVISNVDPPHLVESFGLQEWGFLVVIFIMMTIVRFFLFSVFYPIISRIGTKSCWQEMVFQSFGGLRGAVGIALALALDSEVANDTVLIDPRRDPTHLLFGFTGGIALLTLLVNGVLAGPVLKSLGLNRSSKERTRIVDSYGEHLRKSTIEQMIILLGRDHYSNIDIRTIQNSVPFLKKLTYHELRFAVRTVKDNTPLYEYSQPHLSLFEDILSKDEYKKLEAISVVELYQRFRTAAARIAMQSASSAFSLTSSSHSVVDKEEFSAQLKELRLVFVDVLKSTQFAQIANGQIDARRGMVLFALDRGVASAEDEASSNLPLDEWKACLNATRRFSKFKVDETNLHLVTGFVEAHEEAQASFRRDFCDSRAILSPAEKQVMEESKSQIQAAKSVFDKIAPDTMRDVMSLQLASALLNNAAILIGKYVKEGLLKPVEAESYLEDFQESLEELEEEEELLSKSVKEEHEEHKKAAEAWDEEAVKEENKNGNKKKAEAFKDDEIADA
uniref:Cation/H+ exchanger domain-containing protein n=1 Tax=Chaetoceros debilis TaxID=122233 RepID=A0A7S3PWP7_9STRA